MTTARATLGGTRRAPTVAVVDPSAGAEAGICLDEALVAARHAGVATIHHRRLGVLAITPSGVHVVADGVRCGRVERRFDSSSRDGGFRLLIDGHDRSKLVRPVSAAAATVRHRLEEMNIDEIPVEPHLCVSGARWNNRPRAFPVDDVTVTWPAELLRRLTATGDLDDRIDAIVDALT